MTQLSDQRRTRILPPSPIAAEEKIRRQEKQRALAMRCRAVFERLRPQLIESYYNWHIAIDPDSENYLIDPTLLGITQKIREAYGKTDKVKLTIFRLNDTGTCGSI
ncbi:hypothetical protein [Iningainema tapete]|uniref:Uncharacterized protein n=1 Tax=Iningainema tapete BLCC-T55 TaxID=2748662 RepID=A0A8J6XMY6_9CYAN|nr:hypothetical protein [Iningainema tapete]MBD2777983.1 hypothetical protein [Iningainema tapete BLCC-T55]